MSKKLTTILYASTANLASLASEVKDARDAGQPVRLIALEEFRGETEQNAGAVYVERAASDTIPNFPALLDAIAQAYPHLEVQPYTGPFEVREPEQHTPFAADDQLRNLRMELIGAGGSAPANADAAELADLIAAQRARVGFGSRVPVMPTPATAGTVIPDSTPVVQRLSEADAIVDPASHAATPEALAAAADAAGEPGSGTTTVGAHSPTTTGDTPVLADLSKVATHKDADAAAAAEGVDLTGKTNVADKVKAIQAKRDGKAS